jgi:hypothetical protein
MQLKEVRQNTFFRWFYSGPMCSQQQTKAESNFLKQTYSLLSSELHTDSKYVTVFEKYHD